MKQIGMKQIFNSVGIVVVALLSLCQVRHAFAQLNTFEAGQPIRASEMNHNFEVVQEQIEEISTSSITDAGCSATQQENSVLIECSDGTSGVIAGAGTVVVYPEGLIGEVASDTLPTGAVVWADGNGTVLAEVFTSGIFNHANLGLNPTGWPIVGDFFNIDATGSVVLSAQPGTLVYYVDSDCSGPPYGWRPNYPYSLIEIDGRFLTPSANVSNEGVLMRGRRYGAYLDDRSQQFIATGDCAEVETLLGSVYALSEYTPPPEILNAAYPVRLEQLP